MAEDGAGRDGLSESRRITLRTLFPLCHIHNNPQEEQLLPSVHAQISILFCTPLSIIAAFFFFFPFFGRRHNGAGDVEIAAARD